MSTQIDWREELDSSFGAGADRPPTDYLVPARAALRKRRTAMGAAALVSVIVVGGIGWALAPGESTRAVDDQVASNPASPTSAPSGSADAGPRVEIHRESDSSLDHSWARLEGEVLHLVQDVEVGDWMANPMGYELPDNSVGVQVFRGEEERWMLLAADADLPSWSTWEPPNKRHATFHDWLADEVASQKGLEDESPAAFLDGQLYPRANIELLESVLAPPQAAAYGPVEDAAAVKYKTPYGEIRFALVHKDGDATSLDPAVLEAPTMAAFLAHLQAQGSNGEGLR
jgi:hypothetical protein